MAKKRGRIKRNHREGYAKFLINDERKAHSWPTLIYVMHSSIHFWIKFSDFASKVNEERMAKKETKRKRMRLKADANHMDRKRMCQP